MAQVQVNSFGQLSDGGEATLFTLKGEQGFEVSITNFGASITSVRCPDRQGTLAEVVAGFDTVSGYEMQDASIGAVCGRVAGRIAAGKFTLDGKEHQLEQNSLGNHLHGGSQGFSRKMWGWRVLEGELPGVELTYTSKAGEGGYPGTLKTSVVYILQGNSLYMEIVAATDAPTIVNMTNHAYFNLSGDMGRSVLDHMLTMNAYCFLEIDETCNPTGRMIPVNDTPFDFTAAHSIGSRIHADDLQLKLGNGYDHPFCLNPGDNEMCLAAILQEPVSGRCLEIQTNQPAVVVYTGNWLDGSIVGRGGVALTRRSSICLETQVHPDAINHPAFPGIVLRPGESYRNKTRYTFMTE